MGALAKIAAARIAGLAAFLLPPAAAMAASIEVAPVSVELPSGTASTTVTVTNHSDAPISVQARGFAWAQTAGEDQLTRTETLVVSPPIFTIGANEQQTVRLLLRQAPTDKEASYRLLFDELPTPTTGRAIQLALRLSVPVFAEPPAATAAQLGWRLAPAGGQAALLVRNSGSRHDRLRDLVLTLPNGQTVKPSGLPNPYVLPGVERRWTLPLSVAPGGTAKITGVSESGQIDAPVPIQPGG